MSFKSSVERIEDKAKVTVAVEAKKVDEAIKKEFRAVAKQFRFPGFRPGKAPRSVIEGQVGREYILAQALEAVVNETYPLAVDKEELRTVGKVDFAEPADLVEGEDYSYTVEVALRPEFTLVSTELNIDMIPKEATEAEIDAQIEGTLERFATYPTLEDKDAKVAEDSFLTFSFESTIEGEDYDGSKVERHLYQLGQGMMPEEFDKGLLGAKAGDNLKIDFAVEDTGQNAEFAGKTMAFDLTVDELNEKVIPEVDDDFAKNTGFDTVEDMRAEIKNYIESQKAQSWDRERDNKLLEALAKQLEGEPTQELVEARADDMVEEFSRMLEQSNMDLDSYLEQANIDPEQYQADMEEQASISVANDLALEALARLKDLIPDDEALTEEFEKAASADKESKMSAKQMRDSWVRRGMLTSLRDDLARGRAMQWLRDNAVINIDEKAAPVGADKA
ncbi:MAG: trigger factor [Coriobacteriia bacterium]|nr:trigger factor [Coriobacteriia bacterium]